MFVVESSSHSRNFSDVENKGQDSTSASGQNSTERNVGIGTTNPIKPLQVSAASGGSVTLTLTTNGWTNAVGSSLQMDFGAVLDPKTLIYKDAMGNLDLMDGQLEAAGVVAGAFTVKVVDENSATIGTAVICPEKLEVDEVGDCTVIQIDANNDGIVDNTDKLVNDGKTIFVKTTAVDSASKVFITPKIALEQGVAVTEIKASEGFTASVKNPVSESVPFDWVIIESK